MIEFNWMTILSIPFALMLFIMCLFMLKELIWPAPKAVHTSIDKEIEGYVSRHFLPITAAEVWKRHDEGKPVDGVLYIRVDGKTG